MISYRTAASVPKHRLDLVRLQVALITCQGLRKRRRRRSGGRASRAGSACRRVRHGLIEALKRVGCRAVSRAVWIQSGKDGIGRGLIRRGRVVRICLPEQHFQALQLAGLRAQLHDVAGRSFL